MVSLINTIETTHEDFIHDAELDFYGVKLATCSSDQTVKIFNTKNGAHTLLTELKGHFGPVWQVTWAHPKFGSILASCSYDRKVIIWKEGPEWSKFYEYSNHDSSVNAIAWAPHEYGLILACASLDGTISVLTYTQETNAWDSTKIMGTHLLGCTSLSWCPPTSGISKFRASSSTIATPVKRFVSGGCDNLVKVWKQQGSDWMEESRLELHLDWVRDVAWAPSVGFSKNVIASCSQDGRVIISTSEDMQNWESQILKAFPEAVWSVSWSAIGNVLAVSGADNKVSLWKMDTEGRWTCISEVVKEQEEPAEALS